MTPIYAFAFIIFVLAIGDMIAVKSKSIIPSLFAVSIFFLIAFWLGLPTTIFEDSTLLAFGSLIIPIVLVNLGSQINFKQLVAQWRTVLIGLLSMIGIIVIVVGLGQYFMGLPAAMVAAPSIAGGVVSALQMSAAAAEIGMEELQILASLLVIVDSFIGLPLASWCLRKYANKVVKQHRTGTLHVRELVEAEAEAEKEVSKKKRRFALPEKYVSENFYLAQVAVVAAIAMLVSKTVQSLVGFNLIDSNVLALLFGVLFTTAGLLTKGSLTKANSEGVIMAGLTVAIVNSLSKASFATIVSLLPSLLATVALTVVGIIIFSYLAGKVLKEDTHLAIAIGTSALFGFPGTYIVANEVSQAVGKNEEEVALLEKILQPKMLVAGFTTVSIGSIIIGGVMLTLLIQMFS